MRRNGITRLFAVAAAIGFGLATSASAQVIVERDGDIDVLRQADRWLQPPAQELFMGDHAQTQSAGSLQLSASGEHRRIGDIARHNEIGVRAEYGITDNIEASLEMPLSVYDQPGDFAAESAVNRLEVGAKMNVLESTAPIALSVGGAVEFPLAGGRDVTGLRPETGPIYKPSMAVSSQAGIATLSASAEAELGNPTSDVLNYSVGSMFDVGRITPTLEFSSRAVEDQRSEFYATPGVYYHFNDDVELGVGAAIGLSENSDDVGVMANFNFRIR